jgi:hypothetical protein
MLLPDPGLMLLYCMQHSLRRQLRQVRSNARLYEALADRESNDASRELFRLLAAKQRGRAARKVSSLFNLYAELPVDKDRLASRVWRQLLILCGPRTAVAWIEWRERKELTFIIAAARAIVRLKGMSIRRVARTAQIR